MTIPSPSSRRRALTRLTLQPLEDRSLPSGASYLIIGADESGLPAHLSQRVQAAGGEVWFTVPQIGIAVAESADPGFAARAERIPGVRSVVDAGVVRVDGPAVPPTVLPPQPSLGRRVPVTPDEHSSLQWALDAIDAPGAWALGASGEGVRVAILDAGFRGDHPDLRFNRRLSTSVADGPSGETWLSPSPPVFGYHGTYVAGVVAALDNGRGTVGVSPRADLVAIRFISDGDTFQDDVVNMATAVRGIVYAADIHSDVLNMSFGWTMNKEGYTYDPAGTPDDPSDDVVMTPRDVAEVTRAFRRATDYAHDKGVTMVAAAHNGGIDFDLHPELIMLPRDLRHVISVSATGPLGVINDLTTDLDVPAFYTNTGTSVIDLAAPGGNIDFDLLASGQLVTVFGMTSPAWIFDGVLTTSEDPFPADFPDIHGNYGWGTSFAAPHVAAVAALVIEANGGRMDPDEVFSILKRSADDLGEPGKDAFYGHGRVNAARAVILARHHGHGGHMAAAVGLGEFVGRHDRSASGDSPNWTFRRAPDDPQADLGLWVNIHPSRSVPGLDWDLPTPFRSAAAGDEEFEPFWGVRLSPRDE
jgi:subtilisin family serine protease